METREGTSTEIAGLEYVERMWPDHINRLKGVIQFANHTLTLRRPLFGGLKGRMESRSSASVVEWKPPWISTQLHIEGVGSFESPNRTTVIGRCGDAMRDVCLVIAALWLTERIASESIG